MKQYLVLCGLFLSVSGGVFAQGFSISETEAIAEFLYLDNVLSEVGKEELKFRAREGELKLTRDGLLAGQDGAGSVSAAQILRFLAEIYESAFFYRKGLDIYFDVMKERGLINTLDLDSLQQRAIQDEYERRLRQLPGNQLEQKFATAQRNDSLNLRHSIEPVTKLLRGQTRFEDQAVPTSRSAFGYGILETLASLRTLKLVPESSYVQYVSDVEENGLLPDYRVLQELTNTASDRETHAWRTEKRALALAWLDEHQLLASGTLERLGRDSAFLGATDEYDLYLLFRDRRTIRLTVPQDLQHLSMQFSTALCAFDSLFCELSVDIVSLPASPGTATNAQFRVLASYRGAEISRSQNWEKPSGDRDLLSWVGRYPLDVFMAPYNTLLDSVNASYRLYYTFTGEHDGLDTRDLMLLPLGSRAARAVTDPTVRVVNEGLSGPDPTAFLSPDEAAAWLDSLHRLAYFDSLTEQEWKIGQECVRNRRVYGARDFFGCFPMLSSPFMEGSSIQEADTTNPLPGLPGDYYFLFSPSVGGGGIYLRMEAMPAAYLADLLGGDFRKL